MTEDRNNEEDIKLTPIFKQYKDIKKEYPDCLLFFRLGDFYELFFEDAEVGSKELDIALTGKGTKNRVAMCGVPYHAYESYADKLIKRGYKVAICEQTDKIVNKLVQREVVRVITPGTVVDTSMLNGTSSSYIMCIYKSKNTISYAYSDLSTGEICTSEYTGENYVNYINDQIVRVMPSEIICNEEMKILSDDLPCVQRGDSYRFNIYYNWAFEFQYAEKRILKQFKLSSLYGYDFDSKVCVSAIGAMLEYFKETQKRELTHLKMPKFLRDDQFMYLDTNTRRNLEIEQNMRDGDKFGTLLWVLDNTCTSGGARLLKSWVRQPLQSKQQINARLDMVECLFNNSTARTELKMALGDIQDIERIVGRISYGNVTPKECFTLACSLENSQRVKKVAESTNNLGLSALAEKIVDTHEIYNLIFASISEEAPSIIKEGGYIKSGFNAELDRLRNMRKNSEDEILKMQEHERELTGIKNLKIGYNRVFGYYIEVNKSQSEFVPFHYIRKQTISNNERYITEELKTYEEKVLSSHENAIKLEEQIFTELKEQLKNNCAVLQGIATAISTIDCIYSLASVAALNDYTRPTIEDGKSINIVNGRHPVVEKLLKNTDFIPNDTSLNDSTDRTMILTGPNMAGKSTYMRQVALITYMAHIGSFVSARNASIGIVDRIFTRIGASDDLAVGQSTFMVEMIEVSNILNFATNSSLIILDEVGRGTSTFDGLSIAWSVVEYLSKKLNAKTLFATHYHELMQLEGKLDGVKNYCISIKEIGGKLVFLRRIMRGSATKSYGIEVANLAGLPKAVIDRAKELLAELNENKAVAANTNSNSTELTNILKEIDINTLSPLVAFETLSHLIELVKG